MVTAKTAKKLYRATFLMHPVHHRSVMSISEAWAALRIWSWGTTGGGKGQDTGGQ